MFRLAVVAVTAFAFAAMLAVAGTFAVEAAGYLAGVARAIAAVGGAR